MRLPHKFSGKCANKKTGFGPFFFIHAMLFMG